MIAGPLGSEAGGVPLPAFLAERLPARTHVLLVGGTALQRLATAVALHRQGGAEAGPLLHLEAEVEDGRLERILSAWLRSGAGFAGERLDRREVGTLFIDAVERLSPRAQRLLLAFSHARADRISLEWSGRIIAGTPIDLSRAAAKGRFLARLHDALDKVRVKLEARRGGRPRRGFHSSRACMRRRRKSLPF